MLYTVVLTDIEIERIPPNLRAFRADKNEDVGDIAVYELETLYP